MLQLYLDESGSSTSKIITIAGFAAQESHWRKLSKEWNSVLQTMGLSYFHMREYHYSVDQFAGWTRKRKDILMKRLVQIVKQNVLFKVSASIEIAAYNSILSDSLRKHIRDPYLLCFRNCINLVLIHCEKKQYHEPIVVICDENKQLAFHATTVFAGYHDIPDLTKQQGDMLKSVSFKDDKTLPPLQAADLFAWEANRYYRTDITRKSLGILQQTPGGTVWWTRSRCQGWVNRLKKDGFLDDSGNVRTANSESSKKLKSFTIATASQMATVARQKKPPASSKPSPDGSGKE